MNSILSPQDMKSTIIGALLALVVFPCLSCIAIGIEDAGWTSGTGTHCTESPQETDVFKEKLSGWLKDNGFVPTQEILCVCAKQKSRLKQQPMVPIGSHGPA